MSGERVLVSRDALRQYLYSQSSTECNLARKTLLDDLHKSPPVPLIPTPTPEEIDRAVQEACASEPKLHNGILRHDVRVAVEQAIRYAIKLILDPPAGSEGE